MIANRKKKRSISWLLSETKVARFSNPGAKSWAVQERASKEGSENSGFNSSVPDDRVNETGLYHVNACLQQAFWDPQHRLKCGFQRFMNKQTEHSEGNDD